MRWLRLTVPAVALAAWLASSGAQQGQPPAASPPPRTPPAGTPPSSAPPASAPPASTPPASPPAAETEKEGEAKQPADVENEVFVPTEELQPDAAITFPVDI
jgi:hypothetical protein